MRVIPDVFTMAQAVVSEDAPQGVLLKAELASYQLVGEVMAHQGF